MIDLDEHYKIYMQERNRLINKKYSCGLNKNEEKFLGVLVSLVDVIEYAKMEKCLDAYELLVTGLCNGNL